MLIYKLSESFIKSIDSSTLPEKFPGIIMAIEDNNAIGFICNTYDEWVFSKIISIKPERYNLSLECLLNEIKTHNNNIEFRLIEFI